MSEERVVAFGDVYNSHGCIRRVDQPAPTMTASIDNGNFRWIIGVKTVASGNWASVSRPVSQPSYAVTGAGRNVGFEWLEGDPEMGYELVRNENGRPKSYRVTVQEAGILQSFPSTWIWSEKSTPAYTACGNSVPPLLQQRMTEQLLAGVEE